MNSLFDYKFVGNVRCIILQVNCSNLLLRCFDLAPSIDLKSKMLLDNIGVGVSDADCGSLLHNIELVVVCHHLDTTVLVAHDAFGYAIQTAYIVISSTFTDNAD